MSITVTELQEHHKDTLLHCVEDYIKFINSITDDENATSTKAVSDILGEIYDDDTAIKLLVANEEDKAIGFIAYFPGYWVEDNMKVCMISAFSVLSSYRNKGVGQALFDGLCKKLAQKNYQEIVMTVHHTNEAALSFYDQYGAYEYKDEKFMVLDLL